MASIVRWDPIREMAEMNERMSRLMEGGFPRHEHFWKLWGADGGLGPAIDMYQTRDAVVVTASLPGVKPGEVDISVTGDTLTIKGETRAEKEVKEGDYYVQERRYGGFSRSVGLPLPVMTDKAEAVFEDGVLTVTIPKAEEVKPKTIKVETRKTIEGKK
ncbi:MAG: Hsp20/alpha crystallin family protein [Chloroflexi bacterium]|nr:Hsp20/alpha crystallin family protein [Chloroflexota bacterium]